MKINLRDNLKLFSIAMISIASWLIKEKIQPKNPITTETVRAGENRFYSKSTKIINTDGSGMHLFTLDADYVEQESSEVIKFYDVTISYSPQSKIRWILKSDSASKNKSDEYFTLEGNVSASDINLMSESSVIKTDQLQIDPKSHLWAGISRGSLWGILKPPGPSWAERWQLEFAGAASFAWFVVLV